MATTYSDYNPYSDIKKVYNAKVAWNNATTDEERKKQNEIANNARNILQSYGYGDVVKQISADGADATKVRQIMESYAPKTATTVPDSTTLSNSQLITTNNNEVRNKINQLWGTQTSDRQAMTEKSNKLFETQMNDREVMAGKYDKLEETAYSNPFESEEGKAIIGQYDLKALQGRENQLASGGASNGGNIDSYAAANALRQQAALTSQGQMMALEAQNNKINNVKGILESLGVYQQNQDKGMQTTLNDLGVYQQNQDKGMQTTIGLQSNEGQRLFENDETAKNNETARLVEQANVTGYVPNEWTIKNDAIYSEFLNPDGTFKTEKENVDIQALINQTTDPETKKKLAVVRAKKMLGNYGVYGQYMNEGNIAFMDGNQITEQRRESEQNDATVRESLKTEKDINSANINAEKEINNANIVSNEKINNANLQHEKDLLEIQAATQSPSYAISDDVVPLIKTVMSKVNNAIAKHANGKGVTNAMKYAGDGVFTFTPPQYQASAWKYVIANAIIDSGVPADQIGILLNQLDLTYDDFEEVYNKRNGN